jgi:hypothetical protein
MNKGYTFDGFVPNEFYDHPILSGLLLKRQIIMWGRLSGSEDDLIFDFKVQEFFVLKYPN